MIALSLCLLSALCAFSGDKSANDAKNLLRNGDFEEGSSKSVRLWDTIWPAALLKKSPDFEWTPDGAHGGKHCARLRTIEAQGYSSFTQAIVPSPKDAKSARLEGWVRFESDSAQSGAQSGTPSLMLIFYDPSVPESETIREARLPSGAKGWTKLAVEAAVPANAKAWMVRCGMLGVGTSCFDDVSLTASASDLEAITLLRAHGDYRLSETGTTSDPWIEFSFSFPFEGQTPLSVSVSTKPEGRATRLELVPDRENRYLRVHLKTSGRASPTDIRLDALVMVRDVPHGDGKGVPLAPREKLPKDVALYFDKTPGIDPDVAGIRAVAKSVRTSTLAEAVAGVLSWMREHFKYEGGGDQGGKASFERKNAVCTGHANLAASLFQSAGVPCRVLGCLIGERLQEHYIVELWAPKEGWRRVESTAEAFPIRDDQHLILHVAYPDFERSGGNVPLRLRAEQNCAASYRMGDDHCWQGMTSAGSIGLDPDEALRIEALARAAFTAWEKKPIDADSARLLAPGPKEKPLSSRAQDLAAQAARFPAP